MGEITDLSYYQKKWSVILNKAKDYYKYNKERFKEQLRDRYRRLSEEEKIKGENTGRIGIIISLKKSWKKQKKNILKKMLLIISKNKEAIK